MVRNLHGRWHRQTGLDETGWNERWNTRANLATRLLARLHRNLVNHIREDI